MVSLIRKKSFRFQFLDKVALDWSQYGVRKVTLARYHWTSTRWTGRQPITLYILNLKERKPAFRGLGSTFRDAMSALLARNASTLFRAAPTLFSTATAGYATQPPTLSILVMGLAHSWLHILLTCRKSNAINQAH